MWVTAKDCIKNKIIGIFTISVKQTPKQHTQQQSKASKTKTKPKEKRTKERDWSIEWEDSQKKNSDKLSVPSHTHWPSKKFL